MSSRLRVVLDAQRGATLTNIVALGCQLLRVAGKSHLGTDGVPIPSTKWTVAVGLAFRRCFLEGSLRCRSLILALLTAPPIIVRCNPKIKRKSEDFSPGRASCASPNDLLDIDRSLTSK